MPRLSFLTRFSQTRRSIRALDRLADALDAQTALLTRLANQFAPDLPPPSPEDLVSTGPSFSRDTEQALLQTFAERFHQASGREPTEDEVLEYLHELERPH